MILSRKLLKKNNSKLQIVINCEKKGEREQVGEENYILTQSYKGKIFLKISERIQEKRQTKNDTDTMC